MFDKILIANRGEIACRIIRSCHKLGIKTVAVYSEADENALHVKMADEAYLLGSAIAKESYLNIDKILEIAKISNSQAIHPGYGFLSENAAFAQQCSVKKIEFIGPPVEAIIAMGSKSAAKKIMQKAGVPLVQGYHGDNQDAEFLKKQAQKTGFPVLLKATAGGGGKGMRIVHSESEFASSLASCKREALSSFADDKVLVEKYLTSPRHVEIQIFADKNGHTIHLLERDCSIQRRHQKVIEEAPAPNISPSVRNALGKVAVKAAQAIGYVGAGTVEFLYDSDDSFYFMEMNTRLQVEHPVTEMVTGQDLVEWQIKVACGEDLPKKQAEITAHGHAFEVRIYAEDPEQDFFPVTGTIEHLHFPLENAHIRIDSGVVQGDEVSVFYDPMIAKLIVWDKDRNHALKRLESVLSECQLVGLKTNLPFLAAIVKNKKFQQCRLDTAFIETEKNQLFNQQRQTPEEIPALVALFLLLRNSRLIKSNAATTADPYSPWNQANSWRANETIGMSFTLFENISGNKNRYQIKISQNIETFQVAIHKNDKVVYQLCLKGKLSVMDNPQQQNYALLHVEISGKKFNVDIVDNKGDISIFCAGEHYLLSLEKSDHHQGEDITEDNLVAPMPGTVIQLCVEKNAKVLAGDTLMILEAMKMEHSIVAAVDGRIDDIFYQVGEQVAEGAQLVLFTANNSSGEDQGQ